VDIPGENMDGQERVANHLKPWAERRGVNLVWADGVLRLEHAPGRSGTVVSFPKGFWEKFATSSSYALENALASINMDVSLRYRKEASQYAEDIEVPLSYLDEPKDWR
jgi:hypothetical protein